jgi:tRNA A37 methylthiotransferase MiaB
VQLARFQQQIGREADVFVERESEKHAGTLIGHTYAGLPLSFRGDAALVGSHARVKVEHCTSFGLSGALVEQSVSA